MDTRRWVSQECFQALFSGLLGMKARGVQRLGSQNSFHRDAVLLGLAQQPAAKFRRVFHKS